MLETYNIHNLQWQGMDDFLRLDPHLSLLQGQKYRYHPPLADEIPLKKPGIYLVTGGRQVGKSTLVKLLIRHLLLDNKEDPHQIFYLPCDTLEHFRQLLVVLEEFEEKLDPQKHFFLFIDEVTYVREWDRAIKFLADKGFFRKGSVILTGSDTVVLKEAMMRFPGRRGMANQTDFHLLPLSFYDFVNLQNVELASLFTKHKHQIVSEKDFDFLMESETLPALSPTRMETLFSLWGRYLKTGGFLTALNKEEAGGVIPRAVYQTYIQWIVGDILKRGKNEELLREIVSGLIQRMGSQITWNTLASDLDVGHHLTVADYVAILARMDVLLVCKALREDKLRGAPKKAKKIHFLDPFIFHALHAWNFDHQDPDKLTLETLQEKEFLRNALIEGTLVSLATRSFKTFYIKGESEVDLALVSQRRFLPIEIKWSLTPKMGELKQILKYKQGIVATRSHQKGRLEHLIILPIPFLAMLLA